MSCASGARRKKKLLAQKIKTLAREITDIDVTFQGKEKKTTGGELIR